MLKSKKTTLLYIGTIATLIIALICLILGFSSSTVSAAEKQTDALIEEINYRVDESLKNEDSYLVNGMPLAMSSNPYDYIKDNPEYDKLVRMGEESLDELIRLQQDDNKYDSLQRYIIAIAIEDITKTNLKNSEEYFWEDADSFSENWDDFSSNAEKNILTILDNKSLSEKEKTEGICFYGILANDVLSKQIANNKLSKKDTEIADIIKIKTENLTRDELVSYSDPSIK